ncbi:MAG: ATP-dependent helicase [Pseudomonadota bacterium]
MTQPSILDEALESLNDVQHEAAAWNDGALLVLAGPGSGKTRVLTTRIARILHESPDQTFRVMALTFTNRAADEMRERIQRMAPEAEDRLFIGTFHAFSADVLRQNGQHLGLKTDFRIYSTNDDRAEIARRAITSEKGREAGLTEHDANFLSLVDRAKAKLIPSDGVAVKFQNPDRGRKFEAFYAAYDEALAAANALDFNSLVFNAHQVFARFPALAARYRSAYRYWCVDEFQDTNAGQYELLKAMAGDDFRDLFAVADDDQIIYQWNGADYRRLDQFRADFSADLLQIPTNYRCPAEVVNCANKLIACNLLRSAGKKPLIAGRETADTSSVIEMLHYPTDSDEAEKIAEHIAEHRKDVLDQTVVLARARRVLGPVAEHLTAFGIRNQIVVRRDEFQSAAFNWLHSALRLAAHNTDERIFAAFAGSFNEMFALELSTGEIIARAQADRVDLFTGWDREVRTQIDNADVLELADAAAKLHRGSLDHGRFAAAAIAVFDRWPANDTPGEGQEATFSNLQEDRAAWHALSGEVARTVGMAADLDRFLQELDLRSKEPPVGPDTVALMTIHGSKGNEFDHVYLVGLAEDVLPSFQSKKDGDNTPQFEEERRNCFVAVTRCQRTLTLSYADRYSGWHKVPSRFLREMGLPDDGSDAGSDASS